jgi:hypothetical protein
MTKGRSAWQRDALEPEAPGAFYCAKDATIALGRGTRFSAIFWTSLGHLIHSAQPAIGQLIEVGVDSCHPGAIVRSLLGGFFAINPDLGGRYPAIAKAILSGVPVDAPIDLCLLMEIYLGPKGSVSGGGASLNPIKAYLHGEMVWPPTHLLLTPVKYRSQWPRAIDIIGWLMEAGGAVQPISMLLPVVGDEAVWAQFAQ